MLSFSLLKKFLKKSQGFTFVEIMIVIAIIGITSSFIVGNFVTAKQRARDSQRKSDLNLVRAAIEEYKTDYGFYPCFSSSPTECATDSTATEGIGIVSTINSTGNNLPSKYLGTLPTDPQYGNSCTSANPGYVYWHSPGRQQYALFANLENNNDSAVTNTKPTLPNQTIGSCTGPGGTCTKFTFSSAPCAGTTYNYWITNP